MNLVKTKTHRQEYIGGLIKKISNLILLLLTLLIFAALFYSTFSTNPSIEKDILINSFPRLWQLIISFDTETIIKAFYVTAFIVSLLSGMALLIIKNKFSEIYYQDLKNRKIILEIFLAMLYGAPLGIIFFGKSIQEKALFFLYGFFAIFFMIIYALLIFFNWYGEFLMEQEYPNRKAKS